MTQQELLEFFQKIGCIQDNEIKPQKGDLTLCFADKNSVSTKDVTLNIDGDFIVINKDSPDSRLYHGDDLLFVKTEWSP